jgi:hypothetical protein
VVSPNAVAMQAACTRHFHAIFLKVLRNYIGYTSSMRASARVVHFIARSK